MTAVGTRESAQARRAYQDYEAQTPPRSLERLAALYRSCTDPAPPTRHLTTLKVWSSRYEWQARVADDDACQDAIRRRAAEEATAKLAADNARRIMQMGESCLMLAATAIRSYVAPDGSLKQQVPVTAIPGLVKAGVECIQLASGEATQRIEVMDRRQWDEALRDADPDTRLTLIKGLRAAHSLRRRSKTGVQDHE